MIFEVCAELGIAFTLCVHTLWLLPLSPFKVSSDRFSVIVEVYNENTLVCWDTAGWLL